MPNFLGHLRFVVLVFGSLAGGDFAAAQSATAPASAVMMRDPASTASTVLFVARGELWSAPLGGGVARRLTALGGEASRPMVSPDGQSVAFTLTLDGSRDVFVLPVSGGAPRRVTFLNGTGDDGTVLAWTPDSRRILFLTARFSWNRKIGRVERVPASGGLPEPFPLDHAGPLAFGPDGHSLVLTRFMTDDWARKRYLGGMAPALFEQDLRGGPPRRLFDWRGTSTDPMWRDARTVFFLSDRDPLFRRNLWRLDPVDGQAAEITHFRDGDVDAPTLGPRGVVFGQNGRLWLLPLPSGPVRPIPVTVPDDGARTAPRMVAAAPALRPTDALGDPNYAVLPDGDLVLSARGALFRVPAAGGVASLLDAEPGADADHPASGADGHALAFVSDGGGRPHLRLLPLVGGGAARNLPPLQDGVFLSPVASPDGSRFAVPDAEHRLWLVTAATGAVRLVASDPRAPILDAAFSPDGHWLAFSRLDAARLHQLHLFDTRSGRDSVLDDPLEDDRQPAFAPDGTRLFFVSARRTLPLRSDRDDIAIASVDADEPCFVPLDPAVLAGDRAPPADLMQRAVAIPLPPGPIGLLATRGDGLFVAVRPPALVDGELPGAVAVLYRLDPRSLAVAPVVRDFDDAVVSADGRAVGFRRNGHWHSVRLGPDGDGIDRVVDASGLRLRIDPRAEWRDMFVSAWRLDRDVFLSRAMNGDDWDAVRANYARLLPLLGSEGDAVWLLRQLQGELATSHAFIRPAVPVVSRPRTPLLGVDLETDAARDRIRIARVLRGDDTREGLAGPLDGLGVADGDLLLAIDGHALRASDDPFRLLAGTHGTVRITVADGSGNHPREITVRPVAEETALRGLDHERAARERVAALSGGRLGYLFLTDLYEHGTEDLFRQYAGQLDRQGLVIDVRWNGGGDTSQFVLNLLRRPLAGEFVNRERALEPLPMTAPHALELLDNAATGSDGDQFAFYFRRDRLGEVVGQRTWGGVQGINAPWMLCDGTAITIPKDVLALPRSGWVIENAGAEPDVVVDDAPLEGARREGEAGADRQLDVATLRLLRRVRAAPPERLRAPAPLPAYPPAGNVPGARF